MSLPGVNTQIKDRFYSLSRVNIPTGPRVLAIGTRDTDNGTEGVADLDPYQASSEESVIDAFGEGSQLHRAYLELVSGGASRITLVALPSDTVFNHNSGSISSADYDGDNPDGDLFDDLFAAVEAGQPDIVVPWGRGGHPSLYEDDAATVTNAELGFHADNAAGSASWAVQIGEKMADITANSTPVFAVLGVKPYQGSTEGLTPGQIATHVGLTNLEDRENVTVPYVAVVVGEIKPLGYPDEFGYSNAASFYAAAVAQRASQSAPTGKTIFRVEKLRYDLTRTQQSALSDKGVVPVATDYNNNPIWVDATMFCKATSDYRRLSTLRIVFDAVQLVRQVASPYIGEASSMSARNSLETAITSGLRGMQIAGALNASDFTVTYVGSENKAIIDLVLTPAFELRNIEVRVSVQL